MNFAVHNPATGEVVGNVADMTVEEVRRAIGAAHEALPAWWTADRTAHLRRLDAALRENVEPLARTLTSEQGKPLAEARREVIYAADFVAFCAGVTLEDETLPSPDKRLSVVRRPVGVVASITPWNFPIAMITRKIAPALAAGCTVVVKPAEQTPLSALAVGALADFPPGVLNIVTASDPAPVGREFLENPRVRKIGFTGSTEIGRILMRGAADQIKRVSLELGGNAPLIVFGDADLDDAVGKALWCKFRNAGQTCICANRLYVHESIYDAFAERFTGAVRRFRVGPGLDEANDIGPLIDDAAVAKVGAHVDDAVARGARVLTGGRPLHGRFFQPTVLADATDAMRVAREETFGPVAPLMRFADEDDVVRRANDTIYGLAAYLFTRDPARAARVAERLEVGMVGVNDTAISSAQAPLGGVKQSGIGREGGRWGIDEFLETKFICSGAS